MEEDELIVAECDPSGRFERYTKCLGVGAYKEVYKAFDQEEGVEVAWNRLRIENFAPKDITQIQGEISLLNELDNENIIVPIVNQELLSLMGQNYQRKGSDLLHYRAHDLWYLKYIYTENKWSC